MTARVFDDRVCALGEGPLWHPLRGQLFWFDILGRRLLTRAGDTPQAWRFDEHVSAAGWVDRDTLLIASETGLYRFDLGSGARDLLHPLEADMPRTRSNDGRADPWGGFWIGTMGKAAEPGQGAIYRYFAGQMRRVVAPVTISNAICFSPDRRFAYYADTPTRRIMRLPLAAADGWPDGPAEVLADLAPEGLNPDGAVVDAAGRIWNAQWGAARMACYSPEGAFLEAVAFPATQISCPAFGGEDLSTLFATSAAEAAPADDGEAGRTFAADAGTPGLPEPAVILETP